MAVPARASSAGRRGRPSAVGLRYPAGRLGPGSVARSVEDVLNDTRSVKNFGAVGDGTTDDTAALQAALDYLGTADGLSVFIPDGIYKITSSLNLPNRKFWTIATTGYPSIVQYTDNTPIFISPSSGGALAYFRFGPMQLKFNASQSASNTNAIGIKVGSLGFYNSVFDRLGFFNCYRGISSASGLVWGCTWGELFYDASCTGSMLALLGTAGQPTNLINRGFSRGDNLTEALMQLVTARLQINAFEANQHYLGPSFIKISAGSYLSAGLLVFEEGTFGEDGNLFDVSASRFSVEIIEVQNFTVNASTGNQSAAIFKDSGGSGSRIRWGQLNITGTTITAGVPVFIRASSGLTSAEYVAGSLDWDNDGWRVSDSTTTGGRNRLRVLGWELDDYQVGASTTTLDGNSPKLWRWTGAIGSTVTMTLPSKRLLSNQRFTFIVEASTTGAGSVVIKNADGSTTLATLSTGTRTVAEFRHNTSATNGWFQSN